MAEASERAFAAIAAESARKQQQLLQEAGACSSSSGEGGSTSGSGLAAGSAATAGCSDAAQPAAPALKPVSYHMELEAADGKAHQHLALLSCSAVTIAGACCGCCVLRAVKAVIWKQTQSFRPGTWCHQPSEKAMRTCTTCCITSLHSTSQHITALCVTPPITGVEQQRQATGDCPVLQPGLEPMLKRRKALVRVQSATLHANSA